MGLLDVSGLASNAMAALTRQIGSSCGIARSGQCPHCSHDLTWLEHIGLWAPMWTLDIAHLLHVFFLLFFFIICPMELAAQTAPCLSDLYTGVSTTQQSN